MSFGGFGGFGVWGGGGGVGSHFCSNFSLLTREKSFVVCQAFSVQSRSVMPNLRRWQQSGNRGGWTTHEVFNIKRGSVCCRSPSTVHSVATSASPQHSLQSGQSAVKEGLKSTQTSQTMRTAGLHPFVDASAKQTMAGDRVTKIKHALQV